jgi:hypothetical protein
VSFFLGCQMLQAASSLTPELFCRQIFFEMGFTEMPTNQFVESGFWVGYRGTTSLDCC